jgi:hypothetical protein
MNIFYNNTLQSFSNVKRAVTYLDNTTLKIPKKFNYKNFPQFSNNGNIEDSQYYVNDNLLGPDVLWSSKKIYDYIHPSYKQGNFLSFGNDGNLMDSTYYVEDTQHGSNTLWSSTKIEDVIKNKTYETEIRANNFTKAALQSQLNIQDLQNVDITAVQNAVEKAEKLSRQTSQSIAALQEAQNSQNAIFQSYQTATVEAAKQTIQNVADAMLENVSGIAKDAVKNSGQSNCVAFFNGVGGLKDNNVILDDTSIPSQNVLYSSKKVDAKMNRVVDAFPNTLASFDESGQVQSTNISVADNLYGPEILWTSDKILQYAMPKSIPSAPNSIASLDAFGNVVDSTYSVLDTSPSDANVLWSSNKTNQTYVRQLPGQGLACLQSDGQIYDSLINPNMVMQKNVPTKLNNFAKLNVNGQVIQSEYSVDDLSPAQNTILYSSAKMDGKYAIKPSGPYLSVLTLDYNGNVFSKFPFDLQSVLLTANQTIVYDSFLKFWFDSSWHLWCCNLIDFNPKTNYIFSAEMVTGPSNGTATIQALKGSGILPYVNDTNMLKITDGWSSFQQNNTINITLFTLNRLYRINIILACDPTPKHLITIERLK